MYMCVTALAVYHPLTFAAISTYFVHLISAVSDLVGKVSDGDEIEWP